MRISLIGLGNVGTRVLQILRDTGNTLGGRVREEISVVSVSDSSYTVYSDTGLDPERILGAKSKGDIRTSGYDVMEEEEIWSLGPEAIVDVSSATEDGVRGRDLYLRAFRNGCDVVTANKSPLALHWKPLMAELRKTGSRIRFESTVAGGVPLFNLRDFALIPSDVYEFKGVVSSSVNIILKDLLQGKNFMESVQYAIDNGIAESNYHDDTMGIDAARKTVILANALFGSEITLNEVKFEGVEGNEVKIDELRGKPGKYRVMSHISKQGDNIEIFSGIREILPSDPLYSLGDLSLGYTMKTSANGEILVLGIEDTPLETASGVVNDVALLSRLSREK